ncbi:MAG: BTAD domain-containing putative transcriptional regulator [Actinomycetota bacterium]
MTAGAGFGKTTALANAIAENRLAPKGDDLWLGCEPHDADGAHLLDGLAGSLGLDLAAPSVSHVVELIAAASPTACCLMIDDTHHIPPGSSGAEVLAQLIDELPANGSVLLAGRVEPPVALARLEAQGQVVRIAESDLVLTDEEVRRIAGDRDADDLLQLGGWPALVSLGLQTRSPAAFLDEEVVRGLADEQRRALEFIVTIGGADGDLAEALLGSTAVTTLRSLPLVAEADGWFVAHDLWGSVVTEPTGAADLRRSAVDHLLDRGDVMHALDLALDHPDDTDLERALRVAAVPGWHVHADRRRRWLDRVPDDRRESGAAAYLAASVRRDSDAGAVECQRLFATAGERFRSEDDAAGEVHAVASAAITAYIRRDTAGMVEPGVRLMELAQAGVAEAGPYAALSMGIYQLGQGDAEGALSTTSAIDVDALQGPFRPMTNWLVAQAQIYAGYPAIDVARACVAEVLPIPGMVDVLLSALWREGRVHEAAEILEQPPVEGERHRFLHHIWGALVFAALGDDARREEERLAAWARLRASEAPVVGLALYLAEVALAVEEGESDPAERYRGLIDEFPFAGETLPWYTAAIAMLARWLPEVADELIAQPHGPLIARDFRVGTILRRIDDGDAAAVADLDWPTDPGALLASVMLKGMCELVAAGWSAGHPDARIAADWLAEHIGEPARAHFHRFVEDHPIAEVRKGAVEIVAHTPVAPARHRHLQVLGPARLSIGGASADDAGWRREKVRTLIGYLVLHPEATRDQVIVALWPDADEESGRRNLRSTLNLANKVLEPDRESGDATFFVRSDGNRLRLVRSAHLTVDAWEFERLLDEAASLERDGVPSLAVEPFEGAIELYRGDFLADAAYDDWSLAERDRLRFRFVDAACRAAELRLAGDQIDAALELAARVLTIEAWSERAHRISIAAYLARGDRVGARRAVEACIGALAEFGGPADSETAMILRRVEGRAARG